GNTLSPKPTRRDGWALLFVGRTRRAGDHLAGDLGPDSTGVISGVPLPLAGLRLEHPHPIGVPPERVLLRPDGHHHLDGPGAGGGHPATDLTAIHGASRAP